MRNAKQKISIAALTAALLCLAWVALALPPSGYDSKVHMDGPDKQVIESGGEIEIKSGGSMDVESGGSLKLAGTAITSTAAELNILDGVTSTAAELNILDGVTSTAAELNILDGVTSTAAELNILDGVTSTAAELNILDGVTSTAGELNLTDNMPASVSFAAAAGAANVCEVTLTVLDAAAAAITSVFNLDVWLSDAATCAGLTSTTASGTVQAKAASGADIGTYTAKKALRVQTLATGVYILEITDTAKTGFYVCATLPSTGETEISTQLVTGDYGA